MGDVFRPMKAMDLQPQDRIRFAKHTYRVVAVLEASKGLNLRLQGESPVSHEQLVVSMRKEEIIEVCKHTSD